MAGQDARRRRNARGSAASPGVLDQTDREIVQILQVDGRTGSSEIARRLGVTETTVRKRLAALLDGDYIEVVAIPTPRLAGMTVSAIMGIATTLAELRNISDSVAQRSEVRYCGVSTGRYNLIIEAFFTDHDHLLDFTTSYLGSLKGVKDVETFVILSIAKFSADWKVSQE
ncbi:Lrp/AsnC family transcriptional regulator [Nocardioides houyundeii]|uniref:Lrp/AsnC family transcriptional regulator n=1 Tax=Nocardioides houyundeii TaxID=2045452 RepID=UPI000C774C90|nr:Lrp/AsnC family transcriptional regulator [Nocardioides houyundeii]